MTSTRRWTGWPAGRTRSRPGWPPGTGTTAMLTEPTSIQREGFDLIGIPIPLTLK
jgi:hypothetical protein